MKPKILVTSAAGHTGAPAVLELLEKGFPVRAFVRRRDARAERLAQAGAELFVGNQLDMRDLRHALAGVQRADHCPPFGPNALQGAALFAVAAEEAKLEAVTLMNAWNPHPSHPAIHQREQWIAEQLYQWMPSVDVVHLNPGMFAFTYFFGLSAVVHFGQLMLPFGDGLNAPPSNEDIAAVAAGVIADPAPHIGKHYRPTGPRLLSGHDVADAFARVLGRPVRYRDVPTRMFVKTALAGFHALRRLAVPALRRRGSRRRVRRRGPDAPRRGRLRTARRGLRNDCASLRYPPRACLGPVLHRNQVRDSGNAVEDPAHARTGPRPLGGRARPPGAR